MRKAFAHDAVLRMAPDADSRGPGAAITRAVCGHWEHDGPCPVAPHYTSVEPVGDELRLRVLFAAEPELEQEVRDQIEQALKGAQPEGGADHQSWQLQSSSPGTVAPDEVAHCHRLINS